MRILLLLLVFVSSQKSFAQNLVSGIVVNSETAEPLPYANVLLSSNKGTLTNIDGTFQLQKEKEDSTLVISYVGFHSKNIPLSKNGIFYEIDLIPKEENLQAVFLSSENKSAQQLIRAAIEKRNVNDPEKKLESFSFKSYNKFIIDNQEKDFEVLTDTANSEIETILNVGRAYLSEKTSAHTFKKPGSTQEIVEGLETAGFTRPVYEMVSLGISPFSFYKEDFEIFNTSYAGPLGNNALRNYNYRILDTLDNDENPAYVIYFKPKREKVVAGLEGVLYLDTASLAIQKATAQLLGAIELEVNQNFEYFRDQQVWFPVSQDVTIKPGEGGKDLAVFGGSIAVGAVQRKNSIFNRILSSGEIEENLYLSSTTSVYNVRLNVPVSSNQLAPSIVVLEDAGKKSAEFWNANRQEPFTVEDQKTAIRVDSIVKAQNIQRKLRVTQALVNGFYPVGFFDVDLSAFYSNTTLEGLRLGVGGNTNNKFSEKVILNGYLAYGFGDKDIKHGIGAKVSLHQPTGTWFNVNYYDDIRELSHYEYIRGINQFFLLSPRNSKIEYFYSDRTWEASIINRLFPKLETEWMISKSDIAQFTDYLYLRNDEIYSNYTISEAKLGIMWRPFNKFLSAPGHYEVIGKGFPRFTGQVSHSFSDFLGGDFSFTKVGLRIDHQINRLNQSSTHFTLEGNLALGDLPLTHAFHASPNNPNNPEVLKRFSVAGITAFETMYFNEFFTTRQLALHLRHQFRPVNISENIQPRLNIVSRHVIGDFDNQEAHHNIQFGSLQHGFSEVGLELNNILFGFGLSGYYRYGAYHLAKPEDNLSLKFTFELHL